MTAVPPDHIRAIREYGPDANNAPHHAVAGQIPDTRLTRVNQVGELNK